jgi:hypothetical protein
VSSGDIPDILDGRAAVVLAKSFDNGVKYVRNMIDDFRFRHGFAGNSQFLLHISAPFVDQRFLVRLQIMRHLPARAFADLLL